MEADNKDASHCCGSGGNGEGKRRIDWLLWGSMAGCAASIVIHLASWPESPRWLRELASGTTMLLGEMWWGIALGILAVGLLAKVPREFVMSALGGRKSGARGIIRATLAGLLLDLCNHGILMVAMGLYQRGASVGQTMAFLIASPWNSLTLTLVLVSLVGLPWTLAFIAGSAVVAIVSGLLFEELVKRGRLPDNPNSVDLPEDFRFFHEAGQSLKQTNWTPRIAWDVARNGLGGSRMILRWLLFGVLLAAAIRTFVPQDVFGEYFGPSLAGLALTLAAATVIEVCSEGSTPIAADLLNRGGAPGNAFTFLMAGAATDYTEIMVLRETTKSWKTTFALPLLATPQILLLGYLMNQAG